jgi:hypothetical protein
MVDSFTVEDFDYELSQVIVKCIHDNYNIISIVRILFSTSLFSFLAFQKTNYLQEAHYDNE